MRVKFLRDELFEHAGRGKGYTFKEGESYDFEDAFAQRWIRRGAVEVLEGGAPAPEDLFKPVDEDTASEPKAEQPEPAAAKGDKGKGAKADAGEGAGAA